MKGGLTSVQLEIGPLPFMLCYLKLNIGSYCSRLCFYNLLHTYCVLFLFYEYN